MDGIWLLLVASVMVLGLSSASEPLRLHLPLSAPLVALAVGVAVGPAGAGLIGPGELGPATVQQAARLTLAASLIGSALCLPGNVRAQWPSVTLLLGAGMPAMAAVAGLAAWALLDVRPAQAAVIGAALAPTDPVLAGALMAGRWAVRGLPVRLRVLLSAESGLNDGLALPLVELALVWLGAGALGAVGRHILWQLGVAVALGAAGGAAAGWMAGRLEGVGAEPTAAGPALAFAVMAGSLLLDVDSILAVYVAGLAAAWVAGPAVAHRLGAFASGFTRVLDLPLFMLLGALLPLDAWARTGWPLAVFTVLVLACRRMPALWLLGRHVPELSDRRLRLFAGWFGPMGVSSLFYAMLALGTAPSQPLLWPAVSAAIAASVVAHGVSATPWTAWLAARRQREAG